MALRRKNNRSTGKQKQIIFFVVEPQSGYYLKKIFRWFNEAEGSNTWRTAYDSSWSSQPEISFFKASQKRTQKKKKKHLDTCGKKASRTGSDVRSVDDGNLQPRGGRHPI